MTKRNVTPVISDEELNSYLSIDEQYMTNGNLTVSTMQANDNERKTTHEPAMASGHEVLGVASVPVAQVIPSVPTTPTVLDSLSGITAPTPPDPLRRPSTKQRKASFDEYREVFLQVPKITDRQPVFLSRTTRDRLDEIVRKLGDRKMSVSGLLENIARHHLENYAEDIEVWKRL